MAEEAKRAQPIIDRDDEHILRGCQRRAEKAMVGQYLCGVTSVAASPTVPGSTFVLVLVCLPVSQHRPPSVWDPRRWTDGLPLRLFLFAVRAQ